MGKPSDNILKLRELTEKLTVSVEDDYQTILKRLKNIVDDGKKNINDSVTAHSKIKCYEKMCMTISSILNQVNI